MTKGTPSKDIGLSQQIGKRIRQARLNRGITQEKMAEILDLSVTHYQNIEYGKYNVGYEHLHKICELFNLTTDYILFGKESSEMDFDVYFEKLSSDKRLELLIKIFSRIYKDRTSDYGMAIDNILENLKKE